MEEENIDKSGDECPTWNELGQSNQMPPFFTPSEEIKRNGFKIKFLAEGPRKETLSPFNGKQELWFDVEYEGRLMTWTISQISLLLELKKHAPLQGRSFRIRLVQKNGTLDPTRNRFRSRYRYEVIPLDPEDGVREEHVIDLRG